jgi:hypothetical protein
VIGEHMDGVNQDAGIIQVLKHVMLSQDVIGILIIIIVMKKVAGTSIQTQLV